MKDWEVQQQDIRCLPSSLSEPYLNNNIGLRQVPTPEGQTGGTLAETRVVDLPPPITNNKLKTYKNYYIIIM